MEGNGLKRRVMEICSDDGEDFKRDIDVSDDDDNGVSEEKIIINTRAYTCYIIICT